MPVEHWRKIDRSVDSQALQDWTCTDPPKRTYIPGRGKYHPRECELEVQSHFRGPDCHRKGLLWSGWDAHGLAGLAHLEHYPDDDATMINALGRAYRLRNRGVGDLVLSECIRLVREGDEGVRAGAIICNVWKDNAPSKAMLVRHGFEFGDVDPEGLEDWALVF